MHQRAKWHSSTRKEQMITKQNESASADDSAKNARLVNAEPSEIRLALSVKRHCTNQQSKNSQKLCEHAIGWDEDAYLRSLWNGPSRCKC